MIIWWCSDVLEGEERGCVTVTSHVIGERNGLDVGSFIFIFVCACVCVCLVSLRLSLAA